MNYEVQGKYTQAEPLLVSALKSSRDVLGSQHSYTVRGISNLALHYEHEGLYARAEPLFAEGLEGYRRVLGGEHPETLVVWVHLGSVRIQQRKYAEAELALRDAAQVYARAWPDAWQRYNCQSLLGVSLAGQKRYAEAEPLVLAGYEGMLQRQATISAPSRSTLASAGQLIVQFYQDWGKPDKVAEWKQRLQTPTSAIHAK